MICPYCGGDDTIMTWRNRSNDDRCYARCLHCTLEVNVDPELVNLDAELVTRLIKMAKTHKGPAKD